MRFSGFTIRYGGTPAAVVCALLLLTAACQSGSPEAVNLAAASRLVGDNLLGEACRLDAAPARGGEQIFDIYCGSWEEPSARLIRSNQSGSLESLASTGGWRARLDDYASCAPPRPATALGDIPALALDCTIRQGGWPYQGLVLRVGDDAWLGDSIPATAPVLEKAVGQLTGRRLTASGPPGTGLRSAEQAGGRAGPLYSAGDLASYRLLLHRAQYHNYLGEFPEAEKLYRRALSLQQERLTASAAGRAFVLMSLALELSNQERFLEADAAFAQAEAALPESFDESDEPRLLSYRAIHFANQKRGQRAIELAQAATEKRLTLVGEIGGSAPVQADPYLDAQNVVGSGTLTPLRSTVALAGRGETAQGDIVQSEYVEAAMRVRQGQFDEADAALGRAMSILDAQPRVPRRWLPQIEFLQAVVAEKRGDLVAAQTLLERSITGYKTLAPASRNEALAWLALGRVQVAQGRSDLALQSFRNGFAILQERKDGITAEDAMPYFQAALAEAARNPADRQRLFTEMFGMGQLIRSTRTSQSIALASARLSSSDRQIGRLIRDLQDARQKRDAATEALARAHADPAILAPQLQAMEQRWQTLATAVGNLERQVQAAAPRYQQLLDSPAPAEGAAGLLRADEALVQVVVGPSQSIVFFLDADGIETYAAQVGERDLEREVTLLRAPFDQVQGAPYDTARAHELYKKLLGPVASRLARIRHLIVVPSGPLLAFPFGALVTEPAPNVMDGDYSAVSWLAKRQGVTLAPSVQAFIGLRENVRASQAPRPFIGFGDFLPERDVQRTLSALALPETCRLEIEAIAKLPRLPGSVAELQAARQALGGASQDIHLRRDFSEATIEKARLQDYRVIYFATHAMLPRDFSCWAEPMLVVSGDTGEDDGLLLASEIAELQLDADLVVLSACNTAAPGGGGSAAESLSGLARAFFYAGARSLLVTHWPIPDQPTQRLMSSLFGAIAVENLATAEALRRAQTALIEDRQLSHPLNWAAFSVVGDGGQRLQAQPSATAPGGAS
jgi:CHAT domain-containing protein